LLPILLPALERNGHLHLAEAMRQKILAMSASTIDRLLRVPRSATRLRKVRRAMPAARRRDLAPLSRIPYSEHSREPLWPSQRLRSDTRRSSGGRWLNWFVRDAALVSCPGSSDRPLVDPLVGSAGRS